MIVYDVTDRDSFKAVEMWMGEVDKFAAPTVSRLLIGNKCDLNNERKVPVEEGQALAKKLGIKFVETSAKMAMAVSDAFKTMTQEMHTRINKKPQMKLPANGKGKSTPTPESKKVILSRRAEETKKKKGYSIIDYDSENSCC
jgi:Ras-related protein Rab-1A